MRRFDSVAEYRVLLSEQDAMTEMRLQVEAAGEVDDHWTTVLADALKAEFALRIPIERVTAGSLPRFELKAKRWQRVDR